MKGSKSPISGKQITHTQALKGLGNPNTWKKEMAAVYTEFHAKPTKSVKRVKAIVELIREKTRSLSQSVRSSLLPRPAYASPAARSIKKLKKKSYKFKKSAAPKAKSKKRIRAKQDR
jgi:hypothetical protein